MQAIIFIGISASGKSHYYFDNFRDSHIRINLDMLKTRNREKILVKACIDSKTNFVVDNTNLTVEDRKKYFEWLKDKKYEITACVFKTSLKECILRNSKRHRQVPPGIIASMLNKIEQPSKEEGFNEISYVKESL